MPRRHQNVQHQQQPHQGLQEVPLQQHAVPTQNCSTFREPMPPPPTPQPQTYHHPPPFVPQQAPSPMPPAPNPDPRISPPPPYQQNGIPMPGAGMGGHGRATPAHYEPPAFTGHYMDLDAREAVPGPHSQGTLSNCKVC